MSLFPSGFRVSVLELFEVNLNAVSVGIQTAAFNFCIYRELPQFNIHLQSNVYSVYFIPGGMIAECLEFA